MTLSVSEWVSHLLISDYNDYNDFNDYNDCKDCNDNSDYRDSDLDLDWAWDLQSNSDLDSIRNSCDVLNNAKKILTLLRLS